MTGGNWTTQNKVRPGTYINIVSDPKTLGTVGDRGTVSFPLALSWGAPKQVIELQAGEDLRDQLGYDITAPEMLLLREAFKRAKTVLVYRLNTGVKAAVTKSGLTATAKHGGILGNDLAIVIQPNIDDNTKFDVNTLLAGRMVDTQTVPAIQDLKDNAWIDFSGTGALEVTAGMPLTGGDNGTVTNQDHADYLAAAEVLDFNTLALPSSDPTLKSIYTAFVKRLRDAEGRKIQLVLENYPLADNEGVISVKNGVILADGTLVPASEAVVWVAAATASAAVNQSLTHQAYDDAVDVDIRYTNTQIVTAIENGEFVFTPSAGRALVEVDINTFKSFTSAKGRQFSKNRVIRVLDGIANDLKRIFDSFYIGKVDNNKDGRNLFLKEAVQYLTTLQGINAIKNLDAQKDVQVTEGMDSDSILISSYVQPADAVEKIYMEVKVR
ncbi:phage tail sheath family protein [Paenibacillus sp. FJAT-26967]|uniref:phage tail sheath family protein n=1 Tax=Paenibacillus sp. FJAT-26967 TaxID=1729690 RepID=UPI0008384578|nr:phage tail sheath family protein [Paenibacillus sp. FJAT-26967]